MARGAMAAGLPTTDARILRVSSRRAADVTAVEPRAAADPGANGVVWIVRAEGSFFTNRPMGPPHVWASGYLVIDDSTGQILADGMP